MFSYYKLPKSYPIAKTTKSHRTVYFLPDVNVSESKLKEHVVESFSNKSFEEISAFVKDPIVFKELRLVDDDEFRVVPSDKRMAISVIGNSGSGKSIWASNMIKDYHTQFPDNEVFLLSNKLSNEDPAFEDMDYITYIDVNELTEPIKTNKFENCLFVFDDLLEGVILDSDSEFVQSLEQESYSKQQRIIKERQKQLDMIANKSVENILALGRARNISILIVKHQFRDGKSSLLKTENTGLVSFPAGNSNKLREYLKTVECLGKQQINKIFSMKESKGTYQFVYLSRHGLRYCISNKNVVSIDIDEDA